MTDQPRDGGEGKDQITSRMKALLNNHRDWSRNLGALEVSPENFFSDMDKGRANLAIENCVQDILKLLDTSMDDERIRGYLEGQADALITLTRREWQQFVETLLAAPPPNQALLDAKAHYDKVMGRADETIPPGVAVEATSH